MISNFDPSVISPTAHPHPTIIIQFPLEFIEPVLQLPGGIPTLHLSPLPPAEERGRDGDEGGDLNNLIMVLETNPYTHN